MDLHAYILLYIILILYAIQCYFHEILTQTFIFPWNIHRNRDKMSTEIEVKWSPQNHTPIKYIDDDDITREAQTMMLEQSHKDQDDHRDLDHEEERKTEG